MDDVTLGIDYRLLNLGYGHKVYKTCCCDIICLATHGAYAIYECFCCDVPITHLRRHNIHEYDIDSLWNILFAIMSL
jgi:hypothetical protein